MVSGQIVVVEDAYLEDSVVGTNTQVGDHDVRDKLQQRVASGYNWSQKSLGKYTCCNANFSIG